MCRGHAFFDGLKARVARAMIATLESMATPTPSLASLTGPWRGAFTWLNRRGGTTEAFQLAALHPAFGRRPQRATPHDRVQAPTRVRVSDRPARQRVQPRHRRQATCTSGTVRGAPGNRRSYRRDPFSKEEP